MITKKDLPLKVKPNTFLFCNDCGAELSADPNDYFNALPDYVFICSCGKTLSLVEKIIKIKVIKK